jgi:hypothetical protein
MKKVGYLRQPTFVSQESGYALDVHTSTLLMRVSQFAREVRVMLQLNNGEAVVFVMYCPKVQVCPIYSEAIQTVFPTGAAAP